MLGTHPIASVRASSGLRCAAVGGGRGAARIAAEPAETVFILADGSQQFVGTLFFFPRTPFLLYLGE